MKTLKIALVGGFLAFTSSSIALAGSHNMAGCGLGMSLFDQNTTGNQILAATTNGTSGNQTFGITSGTSGCTSDGVVKKAKAQEVYAEVNFSSLAQDMASGGGEYLSSLGTLLGCSKSVQPMLSQMTQQKYEKILPSENTDSRAMLSNLRAEIAADPTLARSCSAVGAAKPVAGLRAVKKVAKNP